MDLQTIGRLWRNCFALILLLSVSGLLYPRYSVTFAQTSESGTLKVNVDMATVEVAVKDKKGKPISGLKKEDFTLWIDGKKQDIITADEIMTDPSSGVSQPGKVILILFDDILISVSQAQHVREAAQGYVRQYMKAGDLTAVVVHSAKARIVQNFTQDPAKVIEAIRKSAQDVQIAQPELSSGGIEGASASIVPIFGQPSQSDIVPGQSDLPMTLKYLSTSMLRLKGRKAILVFYNSYNSRILSGAQYAQEDAEARYRSIFDFELSKAVEASKQSVIPIYLLDPQEVDWGNRLNEVNSELSHYYILGFQPVGEDQRNKTHGIRVKTLLNGAKLSYQSALVDSESRSLGTWPKKAEQSLQAALISSISLSQLPVSFRTAYFYSPQNRIRVGISAKIQASVLKFKKERGHLYCPLNVMGVILAEDGSVVARFAEPFNVMIEPVDGKTSESEVLYHRLIKLTPGKYRIRLAFVDKDQKIGTAEQFVTLPAMPVDQLAMSSLVVTQYLSELPPPIQGLQSRLMDEDDPLIYATYKLTIPADNRINREKPMAIYFKLYNLGINGDQLPDLTARFQLVDEKGIVRTLPLVRLTSAAIPTGEREVSVALNLPTTEIMPGKYKMAIEITDGKTNQTVLGEADLDIK
jgi:VWFA-related protein